MSKKVCLCLHAPPTILISTIVCFWWWSVNPSHWAKPFAQFSLKLFHCQMCNPIWYREAIKHRLTCLFWWKTRSKNACKIKSPPWQFATQSSSDARATQRRIFKLGEGADYTPPPNCPFQLTSFSLTDRRNACKIECITKEHKKQCRDTVGATSPPPITWCGEQSLGNMIHSGEWRTWPPSLWKMENMTTPIPPQKPWNICGQPVVSNHKTMTLSQDVTQQALQRHDGRQNPLPTSLGLGNKGLENMTHTPVENGEHDLLPCGEWRTWPPPPEAINHGTFASQPVVSNH